MSSAPLQLFAVTGSDRTVAPAGCNVYIEGSTTPNPSHKPVATWSAADVTAWFTGWGCHGDMINAMRDESVDGRQLQELLAPGYVLQAADTEELKITARRFRLMRSTMDSYHVQSRVIKTVATTWLTSLQMLRAESRAAAELLDVLSVFGPNNIPDYCFIEGADLLPAGSALATAVCVPELAEQCRSLGRLDEEIVAEVCGDAVGDGGYVSASD